MFGKKKKAPEPIRDVLKNPSVAKLHRMELAEKSHRNVSQWVTDKVWEADEKDKEKSERK